MNTEYISGSLPVNYYLRYSFSKFKNVFVKSPGQSTALTSAFTLYSDTSANGMAYDYTDYELGSNTITVKHDSGLPSYEGSITLSAGKYYYSWGRKSEWNLSLKYKNGAVENEGSKSVSNDQQEFKMWFPFALATKLGEKETEGTDSIYPTMSDTWWWQKRTIKED